MQPSGTKHEAERPRNGVSSTTAKKTPPFSTQKGEQRPTNGTNPQAKPQPTPGKKATVSEQRPKAQQPSEQQQRTGPADGKPSKNTTQTTAMHSKATTMNNGLISTQKRGAAAVLAGGKGEKVEVVPYTAKLSIGGTRAPVGRAGGKVGGSPSPGHKGPTTRGQKPVPTFEEYQQEAKHSGAGPSGKKGALAAQNKQPVPRDDLQESINPRETNALSNTGTMTINGRFTNTGEYPNRGQFGLAHDDSHEEVIEEEFPEVSQRGHGMGYDGTADYSHHSGRVNRQQSGGLYDNYGSGNTRPREVDRSGDFTQDKLNQTQKFDTGFARNVQPGAVAFDDDRRRLDRVAMFK